MRSNGVVRKPDSYDYRTYLPVKGGLYCEDIFGPATWKAFELALDKDDRSDRWGHVELPPAMVFGPARADVVLIVPPAYRRFRKLGASEHRAFARARRDELLRLASSDAWPYCDPVEKLLAEEGLDDAAAIDALDEGAIEPRLNIAYRHVVNHTNRLRRIVELAAPEPIVDNQRRLVEEALARVVDETKLADLPSDVRNLALGR